MPRFSIHSWNDDRTVNEPWMYPDVLPAAAACWRCGKRCCRSSTNLPLRHCRDYEPIVRPTWLDAPEDAAAWAECDEHLLGPNLLVAPVMEPGATMRALRLPAGADCGCVWDGARYRGGEQDRGPRPARSAAAVARGWDGDAGRSGRGRLATGRAAPRAVAVPAAHRRFRVRGAGGCRRRRRAGRSLDDQRSCRWRACHGRRRA
ncbi:hypothetical protein AB5I41_07310 [Sphingomonas sp. MMS24-JH45]